MKAIIIAGGRGERLRPLTDKIPKPMIKIGDKPLLEHTIMLLKKNGITNIIIALCYMPEQIKNYFGNGSKFGVKISYTIEDIKLPLGTAGAIIPARDLISDTFIVTYADILRELDIVKMIASHKKSESVATINTYKHTGHNFKSSLKFDKNNILKNFTELEKSERLKGKFSWSNGSFYIFEPEIFKYISKNQKVDFSRDVFPILMNLNKKISVFPSDGYFIDIGTLKTLEKARKYKLGLSTSQST